MSNALQKQNYEDYIRFLILRYPKDLKRVSKEASDYFGQSIPVSEVERILQRFAKKQSRDVNLWVAVNLSREILLGSQQRQAKLEAMYSIWDGQENVARSLCCKAPVESLLEEQENHHFRCLKCNNPCNAEVISHLELERLKMQIIQEMREESLHLMQFAEKMGFVVKSPVPVTKNQNFILVDNRASGKEAPIPIDTQTCHQIENMAPMEREGLIKRLEGLVSNESTVEVTFESKDGKNAPQQTK